MFAQFTADVFAAFLFGVAGLIGGGLLFESGKQYVKTAGSNLFQGKIEAVPFLFLVTVFGWVLKHVEPVTEDVVLSIPALSRFGIMVFGSMLLLNYHVPNFRYTDEKSVVMYGLGVVMIALPFA